jgi:exopolysaccharide biosynthesis polyprenyl glycosylphosphotransferase
MAMILALLDAMVVFAAVAGTLWWMPGLQVPDPATAVVHAFAVVVGCIAVFCSYDLYDFRQVRNFQQSVLRIGQAVALGTLLVVIAHAAFTHCPISSYHLLVGGLVALLPVLAVRAGAYGLLDARLPCQRVLLIGWGELAQELIAEIHARPDLRQRVVGVLDDRQVAPMRCARLGSLKDVARVIGEVRPHRVIVTLASRRGSMPLKALLQLRVRGIAVEDGIDVYEKLTGKIAIEALTPSSLIFSRHFQACRLDLVLARIVSVPLVAVALVLLAPLFLLIALAIKLDSPGPVLFVQERIGRGGRLFKLIKFRTMRPVRRTTSHWARDNHARLTRIGRRLRQFRLDELPQLINVVRGDMSLVGPRPHPVSNVPLFEMVMRNTPDCGETIPYYALRSMVRPGLSGWAQVRYQYANDLEEEIEKMRYDLYYIKHMSAWLDLGILFQTLKIVLRGRESASPVPRVAVPAARPITASLRLAASGVGAVSGPGRPVVVASATFEATPAAMALPSRPPAVQA